MGSAEDSKTVGRVESVQSADDLKRFGRVESVGSAEVSNDLEASNL